jgi:hypothetical protein
MAHGLLVKNDNGEVLIDSDFAHYHFLGKHTHSSVTQVPDIASGYHASTGGIGGNSPDTNKGMENMPATGSIYIFSIPVNGANPPICFIKPSSTGSSATYTGIILTKQTGTNWEIRVFQNEVTSAPHPILYCFAPLNQISNSPASGDNYGLKTFNSSGVSTFDSRFKPLKIVGGGEITSPTLAHTGSVGNSWNASLGVNASNVSTSFTQQSNVDDLIFYCPSIAHACQKYEHEEADSGFYSFRRFSWHRSDIWWCFYRSCFRIASTSSFEVNYGVYARGHFYRHEAAQNSVFGSLLGFLFGGAIFGTIFAAISTSNFTNVNVDAGDYLPYSNSFRNRSANSFIISKASYYD